MMMILRWEYCSLASSFSSPSVSPRVCFLLGLRLSSLVCCIFSNSSPSIYILQSFLLPHINIPVFFIVSFNIYFLFSFSINLYDFPTYVITQDLSLPTEEHEEPKKRFFRVLDDFLL